MFDYYIFETWRPSEKKLFRKFLEIQYTYIRTCVPVMFVDSLFFLHNSGTDIVRTFKAEMHWSSPVHDVAIEQLTDLTLPKHQLSLVCERIK